MNLIGRRVVTLEYPPGAKVTIGPWGMLEFVEWAKLDANDPLELLRMWELFAAKIEVHPFDVADVLELDGVAMIAIVRAWTAAMKTEPVLAALRGLRN